LTFRSRRAASLGIAYGCGMSIDRHRSPVPLRWVLAHMIGEYARHLGHGDPLRERIDGRVGR
jgi:hypothetical protein